jgi:quercetin dioxygenase-like cupin family protein
MKKLILPTATLIGANLMNTVSANEINEQTHYFGETQQSFEGPDDFFTGKVKVDILFPENETANYSAAYVTFAAGAHTAWHKHPAGQHMIVTNGTALTGTRDGKVIKFTEGEAVWCPPGIDHWHGATKEHEMTHLVVTASANGKNVIWGEKLTSAEYEAANSNNKN